jgi:hypothetical protein
VTKHFARIPAETIVLSYAFDRITVLFESKLLHRFVSAGRLTLSSKKQMQTTTLQSSKVAPNPRVVRILRSQARNRSQGGRVVPSAAVYKPASKWTVVAAFILAVVLHAGAVVWIEMQQEKPQVAAAVPAAVHPMEEVAFEKGPETSIAGAAAGRTAAD